MSGMYPRAMPYHTGGEGGVDDYADSFRIDQKRDGTSGNKRTAPLFGDVLAQAAKRQKQQEAEEPAPPAPEPLLEVQVSGMNFDADEAALRAHLSDCGEITKVKLLTYKEGSLAGKKSSPCVPHAKSSVEHDGCNESKACESWR